MNKDTVLINPEISFPFSHKHKSSLIESGHTLTFCLSKLYFNIRPSSDLSFNTRGADKSLARPTSRCILFDGENISFDASLVVYK